MELETNHHNLVLEEVEDEEVAAAVEESLLSRQSRRRQNNVSTVVISSNENGNGNGNGNVVIPMNSVVLETANGAEYESLSKDSEASTKLENYSVYFDQNYGTESVDGISEIKNGSVASPTFKTNSQDADISINLEIQKSLTEEMNDQCGENLDDKGIFDSSLTPLEESHEEKKKRKPFNNETRLVGDFDLIQEIDQEETEFDVERVLEKQNTHDLYCPNCNSCITRKVILRRRKRKILNLHRKPKHNKVDTISGTELDANSTNSANVKVHDSGNVYSSGSPQPMTNDDNREREPEVFRCLSCFSFFIPTGDGFKLFRFFGDSPENENVQNLRKKPATNTNWFFSIFTTDKRKTNTEQGNETLADQNGLTSAITPLPITLVNNLGSLSEEARKEVGNSSTGDNKYLENTSTSVGEKSDNASEQANTDTVLYKTETPLPGIGVNTGELAADASQGPPQGGVNSRESSTYKSLMPESQLEIYKNANTAVAEEQPVQNGQASSIQGTSLPPQLFSEGELDSVVAQHETIKDAMFSSSQGTPILEKLKIGVGERAVDAVEKNTGSYVIVNVETRSLETAASQRAQNIDDSTGARSLLQGGTQTYMSEQRGAGVTVDILKSIVYGGLIESITSLGVVSSAAGAGSATLNILALGLANLIGGLFIIGHNLIELKNDTYQINEREDRYQETLGRRDNFLPHATVVIISFLIFGMLPPVIYGFSFRKSDNKDLKLALVGGASLVCIILLSIGKAHVWRQPKSYISTVLYYVSIGVMASGASYIAGDLIGKLLEKVGWSGSNLSVTMITGPVTKPIEQAWASY